LILLPKEDICKCIKLDWGRIYFEEFRGPVVTEMRQKAKECSFFSIGKLAK
jgi:hypothetical protein